MSLQAVPTWPYPLPGSGRDAISEEVGPLDRSIFREYDIRGLITSASGRPPAMSEGVAARLGKAFGTLLSRRGMASVAVGYDSRSYSRRLADALMTGLLSTGTEVVNIGLSSTPLLYFAQHELGGIAGVNVTASHNPNGWAGLKMGFGPSSTLVPEEVDEVQAVAQSLDFITRRGIYREQSVIDAYIAKLVGLVPQPKSLTVVVDGANSISGPIAELVLQRAGHRLQVINRELDWDFPNHEPDPETMQARAQIAQAVIESGADVGLSYDGDGDRLGVTDERGNVVWSDRILALLAADVLARHPGGQIVFDVKCSRLVAENIERHGGKPMMWKTGHSHIKRKMHELGAPFAGERSGHFFDAGDYYGYDDALYTSLLLLRVLGQQESTLSDCISALGSYASSPAMQAPCPDEEKYGVVERFADYAQSLGAREINRINGVRAEFDSGWLLVRASSNLPAVVILAEATDEETLHRYYQMLRTGLVESGLVQSQWENDPWANGN